MGGQAVWVTMPLQAINGSGILRTSFAKLPPEAYTTYMVVTTMLLPPAMSRRC